jgi:hypothetical protein
MLAYTRVGIRSFEAENVGTGSYIESENIGTFIHKEVIFTHLYKG